MNNGATYSIRRTSSYLMHYGVSGQKKGIRRYQNEDGTLTAEGKERYGSMKDYGNNPSKSMARRNVENTLKSTRAFAEWREGRHKKNIEKVKSKYDKKINKVNDTLADSKKNAKEYYEGDKKWQKAVESGLKERRDRLTAKQAKKIQKYESKRDAQSAANKNLEAYRNHSNTAKLAIRSSRYEHARARGSSRAAAVIEGMDPTGILRMKRDKKAYGKYIVYSDSDTNNYNAMAMDRD